MHVYRDGILRREIQRRLIGSHGLRLSGQRIRLGHGRLCDTIQHYQREPEEVAQISGHPSVRRDTATCNSGAPMTPVAQRGCLKVHERCHASDCH
jgi:hypothetical protein